MLYFKYKKPLSSFKKGTMHVERLHSPPHRYIDRQHGYRTVVLPFFLGLVLRSKARCLQEPNL